MRSSDAPGRAGGTTGNFLKTLGRDRKDARRISDRRSGGMETAMGSPCPHGRDCRRVKRRRGIGKRYAPPPPYTERRKTLLQGRWSPGNKQPDTDHRSRCATPCTWRASTLWDYNVPPSRFAVTNRNVRIPLLRRSSGERPRRRNARHRNITRRAFRVLRTSFRRRSGARQTSPREVHLSTAFTYSRTPVLPYSFNASPPPPRSSAGRRRTRRAASRARPSGR